MMKEASCETGASPAGPSPSQAIMSGGGGGDIAVVIRKRPKIIPREADQNDVVRCEPGNVAVYEPRTKLDLTPVIEPSFFSFDHVFDEATSNEAVYTEVCKPLLQSVREGGGAVIFAFGQTGSGKTYTMLGKHGESPGLYGLAVTELLAMTDSDSLRVSFYEVYGTKLFDLLNDRAELKMLQDESKNIHIMGLTERHVRSVDDIHSLMSQGQQLRAIGTTHANDRSSRSHAVLEIKLKVPSTTTTTTTAASRSPSCVAPPAVSRRSVQSGMPPSLAADGEAPCLQGRMTFVDLAGSERASDTAGADAKTRREGAEINKSLLALKECIRAMSMRKKHIPFRGSKLTQILRESFVGLSKTCVIATVSPCQSHCEDTLNTLRYADRIKELKTTASGLRGETPVPCKLCGLPVFSGDRHVCRRQVVQCPHCHADMDRLELEGHMSECKEAPIRCPHCGERLLRGELARHGRRCLKFPIRCAACGQQVPRNLMDRHTQTECGAAKEKCRYCGNMLLRQGMAAHEQVCDQMKVACTFCLKFVKKRGLERHETTCVMNPNRVKPAPNGNNNSNANNNNNNNNTPNSLAPRSSESLSRSLSRDLSGDHASQIVETTNVLRASVGGEDETNENMIYSPTVLDGVYSQVGEGRPRTPDRRLTRREHDDMPPSPYAASMPTPNRSSQRLSHRSPGLRTEADGAEPLVCPYARYGCPVRVSPFNLSAHLAESVREHLEMVTSYADRVDLENSELRRLVVRDASPSTSRATTPQTVLSKH